MHTPIVQILWTTKLHKINEESINILITSDDKIFLEQ